MDATNTQIASQSLQVAGIIMVAGGASAVVAQRVKVPDIVIYLLVGMLLGPAALGWVHVPTDSVMNQFILVFGAAYILFDGGATLRFKILKEIWVSLVLLAVFGVIVTMVVTAVAAHAILGVPWIVAILLGSAIASTDPATLVPVFKQVKVKERVAQLVMSESAMNDATGAILTFAVLAVATGSGEFSFGRSLFDFGWNAGVGLLVGAGLGGAGAFLIAHRAYPLLKDYMPLVTLMLVIGAYELATLAEGSGFMAVFVSGVMLSNNESYGYHVDDIDEEKLEHYVSSTAAVFRIFIFMLLGSQVDFGLLTRYGLPALGVVAVFVLVARPAAVFLCAGPDRHAKWSRNELLFMCWTRETGVIPGALAGLLVGMRAPGAEVIASVTFVAILATILIQAPTTRWLAGRLGLLEA